MIIEGIADQIRDASGMLPGEAIPLSRHEVAAALGMFREIMRGATDPEATDALLSLETAIQKIDEVADTLQQAQEKMKDMVAKLGVAATSQALNVTETPSAGQASARPKRKGVSYAPFPDSVDDPLVKPLVTTLQSITETRNIRELRQVIVPDELQLLMEKGQARGFYAACALVDYQLGDEEKEVYYVQYLGVAPRYRGRGYGAEMLAQIEDEARAAGIDTLAVNPTETSEAFYAHHGFKFIFENPDEDGHEMRKRLT